MLSSLLFYLAFATVSAVPCSGGVSYNHAVPVSVIDLIKLLQRNHVIRYGYAVTARWPLVGDIMARKAGDSTCTIPSTRL